MSDQLSRSPLLLNAETTILLVVDMQEKLLPLIPQHETLVASVELLIKAANLLDIPVICTEQYPRGLGATVAPVADQLKTPTREKTMFSCRQCLQLLQNEDEVEKRFQVVVVGIETHVCVQQTVLDLMGLGLDCFLAVDAVGSRYSLDREVALGRMETSGVTLTTAESILFEWCVDSRNEKFKQISQWVKDRVR